MSKKKTVKVKIDDVDLKYFQKITDGIRELEGKVLVLERSKFDALNDINKLEELLSNFSRQLREKYDIPVEDASINIESQELSYEIEEKKKNAKKEHIGKPKGT